MPLFGAVDALPDPGLTLRRREVVRRLLAGICELCSARADDLSIHQVQALAELPRGLPWSELMRARRRKTLVVCAPCHAAIHAVVFGCVNGEPYTSKDVRTVRRRAFGLHVQRQDVVLADRHYAKPHACAIRMECLTLGNSGGDPVECVGSCSHVDRCDTRTMGCQCGRRRMGRPYDSG